MASLRRPVGTAAGRPGTAVASVAPRRTPVVPAVPVPATLVTTALVGATATRIASLVTTTLLVRATAATVTPLLTTALLATALLMTTLLATTTFLGTTARAVATLGPCVVPPARAPGSSSSVAPAVAGSSGSAATGVATARARPVVVAALLRGGVVHAVPLGWWDRPILPRREVVSVPDVPPSEVRGRGHAPLRELAAVAATGSPRA